VKTSRLPGVAAHLHAARLASTQDTARALAEAGAPSGTLVSADRQTKGRGRMERKWASGPGGLYFTLLLRPRIEPKRLAAWSLRAASAIARAVTTLGLPARVEPPNDVYVEVGGVPFKVAGVLAEAASKGRRLEWLLLGVGVNANNRLPPELARAASLKSLLGGKVDLEALRRKVLAELAKEFRL
jgi:BirA family biotin operon repressor/biotin-[acetyl-CoA-carboxylase] ligase